MRFAITLVALGSLSLAMLGTTYVSDFDGVATSQGSILTTLLTGDPAEVTHTHTVCVVGQGTCHQQTYSTAPSETYNFQTQFAPFSDCPSGHRISASSHMSFDNGTDTGGASDYDIADCVLIPE